MTKTPEQKIRESFYLFCRNMEPDYTFARHHKYIIKKVQNMISAEDDEEGRLLLSVPPGHSKSTLCSMMLPAYILGIEPKAKIILATYGSTLSNSMGVQCRKYMNTPAYKALFETRIKGSGESGSFYTTEGGGLYCVGRGGPITGFRANYLILDDTIKNQQEARSDTILDDLWKWFTTTAYSRLVPPGKLIAFNTRWCLKDLIGKLREKYPKWEYVNLPALCEDEETDPLGRKEGQALWPGLYNKKYLLDVKEADPATFGALYQGNPVSKEACPIKDTSITYATTKAKDLSNVIACWDTAETQDSGCFTVCSIWNDKNLVALERKQVAFEKLLEMFDMIQVKYRPNINLVENASSGKQLIRLRLDKCLPLKVIKFNTKFSLAEAINYSLAQKDFTIHKDIAGEDFYKELTEYPYGVTDDIVLSIMHYYRTYQDGLLKEYLVKKSKTKAKKIFNKARKALKRARKKIERRFN